MVFVDEWESYLGVLIISNVSLSYIRLCAKKKKRSYICKWWDMHQWLLFVLSSFVQWGCWFANPWVKNLCFLASSSLSITLQATWSENLWFMWYIAYLVRFVKFRFINKGQDSGYGLRMWSNFCNLGAILSDGSERVIRQSRCFNLWVLDFSSRRLEIWMVEGYNVFSPTSLFTSSQKFYPVEV